MFYRNFHTTSRYWEIHCAAALMVHEVMRREGFPSRPGADRAVIDEWRNPTGSSISTLDRTPATVEANANLDPPIALHRAPKQLGLKLRPPNYPLDFLVIDHAEHPIKH